MNWNRILVFIFSVNSLAWLGGWIANGVDPENPVFQSLGIFLMSMSPLFVAFVLKKIHKENWGSAGLKLKFKKNKKWYVFSFLLPLILLSLIISLSFLFNSMELIEPFSSTLPGALALSSGLFFAFFVSSIGEELGWRGYLEPSLAKVNSNLFLNHIIVGIVWSLWHLPLLILTPGSEISGYEIFMIFVGTTALAIVYGQLRIISKSVWTCVVLHATSNAFIVGFGSSEVLIVEESFKNMISLSSTSLAVVAFWIIISIGMLTLFYSRSKKLHSKI